MVVAIIVAFVGALTAPWLHRWLGHAAGWVLALLPLGLAFYFASLLPEVVGGQTLRHSLAWVPSLGVNFSFYLDGLSLLFALLITGIGTFIVIYSGGYLKGHPDLGRFYLVILLFMASMLGLVLADNIVTLFVMWELTSLTSYLLIGFHHSEFRSRRAATQALLVTAGGGLALLAGLILLALMGGSLEISELLGQGQLLREHPLYLPALILVLLGAFTKSAQFPFHFWLPNAMEAPTPVSAYLHSATMVKAGVYLLARLQPALGGSEVWSSTLMLFGLATLLTGATLTFRHTDLKRLLAYSTVAALGALVFLIGLVPLTDYYAAMGFATFLLAHSLYKGGLFMAAGAVDHEAGTRDITQLGGLFRVMPLTGVAVVLAGLSLAGLPPVLGFIGKEVLYVAALQAAPAWVVGLAVLGFAVGAMLALLLVVPFFRGQPPQKVHEGPPSLWLGPLVLAGLGLLLGLFPGLYNPLADAVASAVKGKTVAYHLKLWPGFNLALLLSLLTVLLGVGFYFLYPRLQAWMAQEPIPGPENAYVALLRGLMRLAAGVERLLQSGSLRAYLAWIFAGLVGLVGLALFRGGALFWPAGASSPRLEQVLLLALMFLGAIGALRLRSHLAMVVVLGLVGAGVALVFLLQNAPDLSITQFLVETLTAILIALVLLQIRSIGPVPRGRWLDKGLALGLGGVVTLLMLGMLAQPFEPHLSQFFAQKSLPEGFGRNIVNVILVDFRGLDTFGEITVVGLAGLGVWALLKRRRREEQP
ncbi:putative monovalent cation/H+ antiporter subunit A [Meiothermus taiwanensis]|uniref:NADH/Ubiquinone/plastoquinone (Complex I) n=1 Tax=Meiothermus taiwanensis WR-220 TaxID=1339250 RepID=A0ABM6WG25_9DEIN|nr:putative monovalent cation/H+ antiporter subunit A [Meiothermus taiwanensis]AWR85893.1 NADH/Ubiquinone/plastoquinone (complex I) [Meiothermus taiwanensis WR-220]KIQ53815.1 NADH/ubiquinone/plastoquinone [Meiothermus taiwanensis]KZK15085.1 NADH/ubiquinone/plastoquinone [Meiothermus taiwanensis]